ncbi:hypothetical protein GWK08_08890 [Leptobacterium flavescens]|uniref:Uncharacterized protein n=1 Tax=Leptobacterium flavescens TaxID=472055 RepID=A0A6P0UM83_9FLAO|nr:hypothetical protein [Leptobacterium flavescens]NER13550.1 hypothetical protein [Leptobacterium flavescens]
MLDTLEFQLNNVSTKKIDLQPGTDGYSYYSDFNRLLYLRLMEMEGKYIERDFKVRKEGVKQSPTADMFESETRNTHAYVSREMRIIQKDDTLNSYYLNTRGKLNITSADYRVRWSESISKDALIFSLSVPKYLYGHNIGQFVPNVHSQEFMRNPFGWRMWNRQTQNLLPRIVQFIYRFFDDLTYYLSMPSIQNFNIADVELLRIDFCYNQFFPSQAMALDKLEAQKKFYNSRVRKNSKVHSDYKTSFNYRHSDNGFYFKIYHKGEEFLRPKGRDNKSDFKRLLGENLKFLEENKQDLLPKLSTCFKAHFEKDFARQNGNVYDKLVKYYESYLKLKENKKFTKEVDGYLPFKLTFLIDQADKVLRYEMNFTKRYISTIYKRSVFRKTCNHWNRHKTIYRNVHRYNRELSRGNKLKAEQIKHAYRLDKKQFEIHVAIDKSLHKKHRFYFKSDDELLRHESVFHDYKGFTLNRHYKIKEYDDATVTNQLMETLVKMFKEEIEYFQVKDFKKVETVLDAIDSYNSHVDNKILNYNRQWGENAHKKLTHTNKRKYGLSKLNKHRFKLVLDNMNKGKSLETIRHEMGFSKSAYYQLLKDLKMFDIYKQTVKSKFNHYIIKTDFSTYYDNFYTIKDYGKLLFSPDTSVLSKDVFKR